MFDKFEESRVLTFNEIKQAAGRIEGGVIHTPLCVCLSLQ